MPEVTYHLTDGTQAVVDVPAGQSVMDGSVLNNLPGIRADCGGACSCATCHVHVGPDTADLFGEPTEEERDLVMFLDDVNEHSRLACQLIVSDTDRPVHIIVAETN